MLNTVSLTSAEDSAEWREALARVGGEYDVYHLPAYHQLECSLQGGEACLFTYGSGDKQLALPLIKRIVPPQPWIEGTDTIHDAVSAYGYPGVICSARAQGDEQFLSDAQDALLSALREWQVVSVFVRLHPVLSPANVPRQGRTECGATVCLDLDQPYEAQLGASRKSHRYELRRALAAGVTACFDDALAGVEAFRAMYDQRMNALGAAHAYIFPASYYAGLRDGLLEHCYLTTAEYEGELIGGALFFEAAYGVQYHLSATRPGFERQAPMRVILEAVRRRATEQGKRWMHLGGGLGGAEDSLFRFKAGFGGRQLAFATARIVADPQRYEDLCQRRAKWCERQGVSPDTQFFPAYRSPTG